MQSFPSGLYHFYEIKSVCLSGGQAEASARARTLRGLGFAWMDIDRIALQSRPKKEKGKERGGGGGSEPGHTASRAIRASQRRKERGRCYQERKELERAG